MDSANEEMSNCHGDALAPNFRRTGKWPAIAPCFFAQPCLLIEHIRLSTVH